jgi:uncharacterized Ntn-hydrolase superfamily protein
MYDWTRVGTFSIVAHDADRDQWGVAVATKPMSVGAVVPWAEWRVGAIATQAMSNYHYGPDGLALLRRGRSAQEVVDRLTRADRRRDQRQRGVVDRRGRAAAWTGKKCLPSALHVVGENFSCQGNLLASPRVVEAMARTYESSRGTLGARLLKVLQAGARQGGDRRGMESAALVVVWHEPWFDRAWGERWVDLRVDQHPTPVRELGRLLRRDEGASRRLLAEHARSAKRR